VKSNFVAHPVLWVIYFFFGGAYVEPGRVCFINYGEDYGKMVVIVDFVDINRVMVDGMGQFPRVLYPLKRLTLTKLKVANILKGARTGTLKK